MPVLGKKQGHKLRVNCLIITEIPSKEAADEIAIYRRVITGKMYIFK
jgi:hypothetical protein